MPRYVVQRTFPFGLLVPPESDGMPTCKDIVAANARAGVTWVHSYITEGLCQTFCIYDSPNPEAIRAAARDNEMSADSITEVRVLDPYFYKQ